MARAGNLVLRDVDFGVIYPVTADSTAAFTLGNGSEVKGIRKLEVKPEIDTDELYGSAKILDIYAKAKKATFTLENAVLSLDVLEKITGGISISTGTTPNEQREFIWSADDPLPYFQLVSKCDYQGGELTGGTGDSLFVLHKCKMTSFTVGMVMDGYAIGTIEGIAISPNYTDPTSQKRKLFSIHDRESKAAIALAIDSTPPTLVSVTLNTPAGTALATGDTGIDPSSDYVFNYSEALHKSWIDGQFTLTNATTGAEVAVTATLHANGQSVVVSPVSKPIGSAVYLVDDSTNVRDVAGNRKAARNTRRYTTS